MLFFHQIFDFLHFQKNVAHVLGGILISIRTQFQVDTFKNDVFIALETSKMATFHDIPRSRPVRGRAERDAVGDRRTAGS